MINTYGLTMIGLRQAAGNTHFPAHSLSTQISYDTATGQIHTAVHASANSWVVYRSPTIIYVCHANHRLTMQQIADRIAHAVMERNSRAPLP